MIANTWYDAVTMWRPSIYFDVTDIFWGRNSPQWARASSFTRFLDQTQRRTTVGRTPLDEWSVRRRDLYLTTHNTHKKKTSMSSEGFEPTVPASQRSQTHSLDHTATGTGELHFRFRNFQHQVTSDFTRSTTDMEDTMLAGIESAYFI
jgi:hypothetical protein